MSAVFSVRLMAGQDGEEEGELSGRKADPHSPESWGQAHPESLSWTLWSARAVAPLPQELHGVVTGDCRNSETGRQHFAPYVS